MKHIVQIISRFLTAYFIALPILFGLHSVQHLHHEIEDHKDALEIEGSLDCSMCDMYDNQSAVVSTTFTSDITLVDLSQKSARAEDLTQVSAYYNYLRGPPCV